MADIQSREHRTALQASQCEAERVTLRPMFAIVSDLRTQEPEEIVLFRSGDLRAISVALAPGDAQMLAALLSQEDGQGRLCGSCHD